MNPWGAGGRYVGLCGRARLDESGREGTLTRQHVGDIGQRKTRCESQKSPDLSRGFNVQEFGLESPYWGLSGARNCELTQPFKRAFSTWTQSPSRPVAVN